MACFSGAQPTRKIDLASDFERDQVSGKTFVSHMLQERRPANQGFKKFLNILTDTNLVFNISKTVKIGNYFQK